MTATIYRIGLTGNIGSGKSEVATLLRSAGICVVDLDEIGRRITEIPEIQKKIVAIFGARAVSDGQMDRSHLREVIFSDPTKRQELERLLHPIIWKQFETEAEKLSRAGYKLVVCEAALLFESGIDKLLDAVIVVAANEQIRQDRLLVRDGMTPVQFSQIAQAQISDDDKLQRAHYIIDNSGSIEALRPQITSLINRWRSSGYLS